MALDWTIYTNRIGLHGDSKRDRHVSYQKRMFEATAIDTPGYCECKVDGVSTHLVFLNGKITNAKSIVALPNNKDIFKLGSIIEWNDSFWIVTEVDFHNEIEQSGTIYQCNQVFRFQVIVGNDLTIYERHGVIDSGVYSTTEKTLPDLILPDEQYKIILPYDDKTSKLYKGKRLAISTWIDENYNTVMLAYRITSVDPVTNNYGNGNILIIKVRSEQYVPEQDDIAHMVCDYVSPAATPDGSEWI